MTLHIAGLFPLGRIVATHNAMHSIPDTEMQTALRRHHNGDWGDVSADDKAQNVAALSHGQRILSAYSTATGTRFWIITEADRSATTVLLPDEY